MKSKRIFLGAPAAALISAPAVIVAGCGEGISASVWKHGATSTELWGVAEKQKSIFLSNIHFVKALEVFTSKSSTSHLIETENADDPGVTAESMAQAALNNGARVFLLLLDDPLPVITKTQELARWRSNDLRFIVFGTNVDHPQVLSVDFNIKQAAQILGIGASIRASQLDEETPLILVSNDNGTEQSAQYLQGLKLGIDFYNRNIRESNAGVRLMIDPGITPAATSRRSPVASGMTSSPVQSTTQKMQEITRTGVEIVMTESPTFNLQAKDYFVENKLNSDVIFPFPISYSNTDIFQPFSIGINYLDVIQMLVNNLYDSSVVGELLWTSEGYARGSEKLGSKIKDFVNNDKQSIWGKKIMFNFDEYFLGILGLDSLQKMVKSPLNLVEIKNSAPAKNIFDNYDIIID